VGTREVFAFSLACRLDPVPRGSGSVGPGAQGQQAIVWARALGKRTWRHQILTVLSRDPVMACLLSGAQAADQMMRSCALSCRASISNPSAAPLTLLPNARACARTCCRGPRGTGSVGPAAQGQ